MFDLLYLLTNWLSYGLLPIFLLDPLRGGPKVEKDNIRFDGALYVYVHFDLVLCVPEPVYFEVSTIVLG